MFLLLGLIELQEMYLFENQTVNFTSIAHPNFVGFAANSSKDPRVEPPVEQQSAAVTPHAVYGAPALGQQSPPGEEKGAYETLRLSEDEGK